MRAVICPTSSTPMLAGTSFDPTPRRRRTMCALRGLHCPPSPRGGAMNASPLRGLAVCEMDASLVRG